MTPRTAWVERNPAGRLTTIHPHRPGTNGIPNVAAGYTVEEMLWDQAHALLRQQTDVPAGDPS